MSEPQPSTGFDDIDATIAGLHALAAWRSAHPDVRGDMSGTSFLIGAHDTDDPAATVRAIKDGAPLGAIDKSAGGDGLEHIMFIRRDFGGDVRVSYHAPRDEVCVRKVVDVVTEYVPDPAAPLVAVEREIVEWDCAPILGGAA